MENLFKSKKFVAFLSTVGSLIVFVPFLPINYQPIATTCLTILGVVYQLVQGNIDAVKASKDIANEIVAMAPNKVINPISK